MALSDQLIDAIIETGEGDFSRDLSTPLASLFTMKFLGLPLKDCSDYASFIQSATGGSGSIQPRTRNLSERELGDASRLRCFGSAPASGRRGYRPSARRDSRWAQLDSWEIEAFIWPIIGNMAATQACLASGFAWLSRNPEQRRRLARETPHLMPHAIEEFLRVFTPVHALGRTVMRDVELAGQSLKWGARVILSWVSANLDETSSRPEEVDFDRANERHLAFGLGGHRCMAPDVVGSNSGFCLSKSSLLPTSASRSGAATTAAPGVVWPATNMCPLF